MEPTSLPIIAYVIRGGACIGVSCGCLIGLLRAKYKDDLRRESQKHRIAKDRSSGRSSMLSAPLIACKPDRLIKHEDPDDLRETPATVESANIFAACVPVEAKVEEEVQRVSPVELFQARPPLEKAPDLSRLGDMSDKLDEKAFLRILKSLVAEAKYLQNDPEMELVPEEWRAAQLVRDELDCFAQRGYGPLVIQEYGSPFRPNLSISYRSQNEIEGSIAFAGVHLDVAAVPKEEQPPGNVVGCCRWCWRDKLKPFKMVQQGDKILGWATSACLGHVALLTQFLLELAVKKPKLKHEIVVLFFAGREGGEADIGADLVLQHVVERKWTNVLADPRRSSVFWLGVGNSGLCYGSTGSLSWTLEAETPNERALELIAEALSYIRECFEERFKPLAAEDKHCFTHSSRLKPKVVESKGKIESRTGDDQLEATKAEAHGEIYVTPFYSTDAVIAALEEFVAKINSDLKYAEQRSRRGVQAGAPSGQKRNWSVFVQAPRKLGHEDIAPRRPSLGDGSPVPRRPSLGDGSADLVPTAPSRGPALSMCAAATMKEEYPVPVAAPVPRRHSVSLPCKDGSSADDIDSSINDFMSTVKEDVLGEGSPERFRRQASMESAVSEVRDARRGPKDRHTKAKLTLIWQGRRIDIDSDDTDEDENSVPRLSEEERKTRREEKRRIAIQRKEDVCRFAHDLEGIAVNLKSPAHYALKQALTAVSDEEPQPFSIIGCVPHARRWKDQGFDVQLSGFGLLDRLRRKNEHCLLTDMRLGYKVLMHIVCYLEEDYEHRLEETGKILREMEEEYPFVEKVVLSNQPGFEPEVEDKDVEIVETIPMPEFQAQFSSESRITTEGAESNGSDARSPSSAYDWGSSFTSAWPGGFFSGWGNWLAGIQEEEESPDGSGPWPPHASEFFNHEQPVVAGDNLKLNKAEGGFGRSSSDPVKASASMAFVADDTDEPHTPKSAPPILIRPGVAQALAFEEDSIAEVSLVQMKKSKSDPGTYAPMAWIMQALSEEAETTNPEAAVEVKKEEHPSPAEEVPQPGSLQGIWANSSGKESYKLTTVGARYYLEQPEEDGKLISGMLAHDGEWYRGSLSKDDKHWGQIRVRLRKGRAISNFRKTSDHGWQEDNVAELKSTDVDAGDDTAATQEAARPQKSREAQQVDFKVVEKIVTVTGERDVEIEADEVKDASEQQPGIAQDQLSPPSRWSPFNRLPSLRRLDLAPESLPMPTKWTNSIKKRRLNAAKGKRMERQRSEESVAESPERAVPSHAEVAAEKPQAPPKKKPDAKKFASEPPLSPEATAAKTSSSRKPSPVPVPQPSFPSDAEAPSTATSPEARKEVHVVEAAVEEKLPGIGLEKSAASGDAVLDSQAPLSVNGTDMPPVVDSAQADAEISGLFSRQASGDLDDAANASDAVRTKKSWFSFIVPKSRFHGASTVRVPHEEETNQDLTANSFLLKVTSSDRIGSPSLPETDEASSVSSPKITPQMAKKRQEELKSNSSNDLQKANETSDRTGAAATTNEIDELEEQKFEP